jgi:hypothetical protein
MGEWMYRPTTIIIIIIIIIIIENYTVNLSPLPSALNVI